MQYCVVHDRRWSNNQHKESKLHTATGFRTQSSLRQGMKNILHEHRTNHHLLTVHSELGFSRVLPRYGDEHETAAAHRLPSKPRHRWWTRRKRRTEVKQSKEQNRPENTDSRKVKTVERCEQHTDTQNMNISISHYNVFFASFSHLNCLAFSPYASPALFLRATRYSAEVSCSSDSLYNDVVNLTLLSQAQFLWDFIHSHQLTCRRRNRFINSSHTQHQDIRSDRGLITTEVCLLRNGF